jgi:hypothetical protein
MNPRFPGEQDENFILIVVHVKGRRVTYGRMVLHHACAILTELRRNANDDQGIDKPQSLHTIAAHG